MISRRTLFGAGALSLPAAAAKATPGRRYRRIATEEAFAIPEWFEAMDGLSPSSPEANEARFLHSLGSIPSIRQGLLDFDERLKVMDQCGVDVHLLSLTTPGVQSFQPGAAVAFARMANDRLAQIIRRHPTRFAGLACVAPQNPAAAVAEIDRAMTVLGFNGVLINSYTHDEYLDDPKFEPILAALERHGAPLYLHPRPPSPSMVQPYLDYDLLGAIWGFAADAGLHALRLIMGGVFDRHPQLTVVLGHMGEAIPYWLWRIDNMFKKTAPLRAAAHPGMPDLNKLPSQYFRENFYITTSGVNAPENLKFALELMGADRIMFAIDYPFESSAESVAFLDAAPLTRLEREKIAYRNAERVFRIRPAAS